MKKIFILLFALAVSAPLQIVSAQNQERNWWIGGRGRDMV